MSNDLIVRCFMENAREEDKKVIMKCGNTYEDVDLNKYKISKNTLVINDEVIDIRGLFESMDGYSMRVGGYLLQAV